MKIDYVLTLTDKEDKDLITILAALAKFETEIESVEKKVKNDVLFVAHQSLRIALGIDNRMIALAKDGKSIAVFDAIPDGHSHPREEWEVNHA